jgi:hypothetical protein
MVFNATFNNISVILWRAVFFEGGKHLTMARRQSLKNYQKKIYREHIALYYLVAFIIR